MVVQGVRPITQTVEHGHKVDALLLDHRPRRSQWAEQLLVRCRNVPVVHVPADLMAELGGRDDGPPEILALVRMPADDLTRLPHGGDAVIVVFDRPASPGNIGSLARSVDALTGGGALITTGHSADAWDPASIRASTGSIFAIPVVRADSHDQVLSWVRTRRNHGVPFTVIGTDETGTASLTHLDLTGPVVIVIGSESAGMSAAWRNACDDIASIPMIGSASSLNAACAGAVVLYETLRQRNP